MCCRRDRSEGRVSIHVPTRGTTKEDAAGAVNDAVFQSTFPRGERLLCTTLFASKKSFNPRSHEGNDEIPPPTRGNATFVSIHVPTRGTTLSDKSAVNTHSGFNPRSHEGNDTARGCRISLGLGFNPRSHEGNDVFPGMLMKSITGFNPRSHEGNDDKIGLLP